MDGVCDSAVEAGCGVVGGSEIEPFGVAVVDAVVVVPGACFSLPLSPAPLINGGLSVGSAPVAVDLRRGGGLTANSCGPGIGGGRKEDDGEGKGDAEAGVSTCRDRGRDVAATGMSKNIVGLMIQLTFNNRGHDSSWSKKLSPSNISQLCTVAMPPPVFACICFVT